MHAESLPVVVRSASPVVWQPESCIWPEGTPIWRTQPEGVHICRLNGQWLSRDHWEWPLEEGDVIEWYEVAQDRGALRSALQIAVAVAAAYVGGPVGLAISVAGNLAINALLPLQAQNLGAEIASPSPTYNTSISGNQARIYQPIPKILGTHLVYPPFAAQPYAEFEDNDQYYYALFAVGVGQHSIIRALIDDTDINRFADVLVSRYLPPGTAPTSVAANVVNAPEVAGGELLPGRYMGGFAACGPRLTAARIGIDVVAPRGLIGNDGSARSVTWRVESRPIDDFGAPLAPWSVLATETRTATTSTAQRWTNTYTLSPVARVEVRVVRTDAKDGSFGHEIQWAGLRAYLSQPAPLNPNVAHYELVMRASEQLSGLSQRRFALLAAAHARTWNASTGWGPYAPTRNPAWWLAELWSSSVWGEGLPDSRIDLPTLAALAEVWDERQDRCDYVLDSTMDAWECAQLIARTGRARVFRRGGVYTLARDEAVTLPVTAFNPRNCAPESMTMSEALRTKDGANGIVVEYFDNRRWDWTEITQALPGVTEVTRPVIVRLPGVTGETHARREALYEAASLFYRTRSVSCVTEMQGLLPAYLQPVLWQPDMTVYGGSGDVVGVSGAAISTSEPIPEGSTTISLIRVDGTVWTSTGTRTSEYLFTAASAPDFTPITNSAYRERTKYMVGGTSGITPRVSELVRISAISDGGKVDGVQMWRIDASIDDARVHTADTALLPAGETVQDPIDTGATAGAGGGGGGIIVAINHADFYNVMVSAETPLPTCSFTLGNNGVMSATDNQPGPANVAGQWTPAAPITTGEADDFEVRVTVLSGSLTSGATGSWLNLGTSRTWAISIPWTGTETASTAEVLLRVEIRDVASSIVQDTADIRLRVASILPAAP